MSKKEQEIFLSRFNFLNNFFNDLFNKGTARRNRYSTKNHLVNYNAWRMKLVPLV